MGKDFQPRDAAGNVLSEEELADFFATDEWLEVPFEKNSKTIIVGVQVDPNRISTEDLNGYRSRMADLAVDAEALKTKTGQEPGVDSESDSTAEDVKLLTQVTALNDRHTAETAAFLAKLVIQSRPALKDFTDPAVLCEREGIGPAVRGKLNEYFFGSSTEPEAETGTPETQSTEIASGGSEQTASSVDTPPTS